MKKLILVLVLIAVVLVSGCTESRDNRSSDFCKTRGYDDSDYRGWGEGYCYRDKGNDTLEMRCFDYINGRYFFVECES